MTGFSGRFPGLCVDKRIIWHFDYFQPNRCFTSTVKGAMCELVERNVAYAICHYAKPAQTETKRIFHCDYEGNWR